MTADNSCPPLARCAACHTPARVLLRAGAGALCPTCSEPEGVEIRTGHELAQVFASRLPPVVREPRRARRQVLTAEQQATMIANLNRILEGCSNV